MREMEATLQHVGEFLVIGELSGRAPAHISLQATPQANSWQRFRTQSLTH